MDITLALGGGGVRGYAHIGVMKVLEREGFKIRAIAGTSAGGMVGAIYAAGHRLEQIEEGLAQLDQRSLYKRLPGDGPSLMGLGGVTRELARLLGEKTFSDLEIPFACTAVDLEKGEPVTLNYGRVLDAVLTTIAVPGIFPPRVWDGRLMVDGGLLDPVPVALARALAPRLPVVAVALTASPDRRVRIDPAARLLGSMPLGSRLAQMRIAQSLNIFLKSIDVAGCYITELKLEIDQPEVLIRPDVDGIHLTEKVPPLEIIGRGEAAAEDALPVLRQLSGWRNQLSQRFPWLSDFLVSRKNGI